MGLGNRINEAREQLLGLTQRELGDELGVEAITVSRWERDVVRPRPQHLRELARLIDRPVSWFYEEVAA